MQKSKFYKSFLFTASVLVVLGLITELLPTSFDYYIRLNYLLGVVAISVFAGILYFLINHERASKG